MTPEQEKQWQNDFVNTVMIDYRLTIKAYNGTFINKSIQSKWEIYQVAREKAQEEIDKYIENLESIGLQKTLDYLSEIQKLKLKIEQQAIERLNAHCSLIESSNNEICKRDKLLEQAKHHVQEAKRVYASETSNTHYNIKDACQWEKDYEELTKGSK